MLRPPHLPTVFQRNGLPLVPDSIWKIRSTTSVPGVSKWELAAIVPFLQERLFAQLVESGAPKRSDVWMNSNDGCSAKSIGLPRYIAC